MSHIMKTSLIWHDSTGTERETDIAVEYDRYPGFAGSMVDPPYDATIEIIDISGIKDIPVQYVDRGLLAEACMDHWTDEDAAERERAAEDRAAQRNEGI